MKLTFLSFLLITGFVGFSQAEVQVPCSFLNSNRGYTCRLPNVNLADVDYEIFGGQHLPGFNDSFVTSFVSINNNFRNFPRLFRFSNLRHIQVTGSLIERLEAEDLEERRDLESLNLDNNQISSFGEEVFSGAPNLRDATFRFNRVRNLFPAIFTPLTALTDLDLSYNLIERLSNETLFRTNNRLVSLQVAGNNINFVDWRIFSNLPALTVFDFSSNICYSGSFFGVNQNNQRNQMLARLQPCFTLAPINVQCQFSMFEMNSNVGYGCVLSDVKVYDRNHRITVGGFHIAPNTNNDVRFLRIEASHTPFVISELFSTFPNLEGFEVVSSDLAEIGEESFEHAQNLKFINIRNNPLRRLEANVFRNATQLEHLQLWWNRQLTQMSENAFTGLENLVDLQIISSNVPNILPRTFRPLTSLESLELGQNNLQYIDSRWFATNRQLSLLKMNANSISAISRSLLDLPNLSTLSLQGNNCVSNIFFITDNASRENVRRALIRCFDNYPTRKRRFVLDVEGDVTFLGEGGNEIVTL